MKRLHRRLAGARFLVACYKECQLERCRRLLAARAPELWVSLHLGKTSEIIELAEVCLMVSGSVSLEVLARKKPAVVVYRINRAFYWWCKVMITCKFFSLPNLIAGRHMMPEFAPVDHPESAIATMTDILHRWLTDEEEYSQQQAVLARLRDEVATPGATANAARAILSRLPGVDGAALRAA